MNLRQVKADLSKCSNKKHAKLLQRYFKTGPGEYAEGDIFIGITAPAMRQLAKKYQDLAFDQAVNLLKSPIHEERLLSLLIFIRKYQAADLPLKEKIYKTYLRHTKFINNWDLVDVTAKHIVGAFLMDKDKAPLYRLAKSDCLWERRIAILSTFYFIGKNQFDDTLKIAEILLFDQHDLIHKAVGWMLREVGKRDLAAEERFLKKHAHAMPRTMLRYAIERFPESKRLSYLNATR